MTPENDTDAGDDTSSQEPVISSTPPVSATATVTAAAASDNMCEVCLIARRHGEVLVPYSRFCCNCEDTVADMPNGCHVSRIKQYLHSCPEQRNSVRHIPGPDFQLPLLCTMITLGEKKALQRFPRIWPSITGTTFFARWMLTVLLGRDKYGNGDISRTRILDIRSDAVCVELAEKKDDQNRKWKRICSNQIENFFLGRIHQTKK